MKSSLFKKIITELNQDVELYVHIIMDESFTTYLILDIPVSKEFARQFKLQLTKERSPRVIIETFKGLSLVEAEKAKVSYYKLLGIN